MTLTETWNNLCTPAQLYFIMTAIGFLFTAWGFPKALNMSSIMYQVLITLIWTYLLGWICTKGWSGLSWFLVIAPFVLTLFVMYTLYTMKNNLERAAQQKAAQQKAAQQKAAQQKAAQKKVTQEEDELENFQSSSSKKKYPQCGRELFYFNIVEKRYNEALSFYKQFLEKIKDMKHRHKIGKLTSSEKKNITEEISKGLLNDKERNRILNDDKAMDLEIKKHIKLVELKMKEVMDNGYKEYTAAREKLDKCKKELEQESEEEIEEEEDDSLDVDN